MREQLKRLTGLIEGRPVDGLKIYETEGRFSIYVHNDAMEIRDNSRPCEVRSFLLLAVDGLEEAGIANFDRVSFKSDGYGVMWSARKQRWVAHVRSEDHEGNEAQALASLICEVLEGV